MKKYFYEAFEGLARLAPGSEQSTMKAISLVNAAKEKELKILDIGCGTGIHTMILANWFPNAQITAIDTNPQYLETLQQQLRKKGLEERVEVRNTSMLEMDFPPETFDLIWAEGSIYIAGFQEGLHQWKQFLKQDGELVCSEISWLHANPSKESKEFWTQAYPEIDTISNKVNQLTDSGYAYRFSFVLPKKDWINEYYHPLERNLEAMERQYNDTPVALDVVNMIKQEINLYHKHSQDYSYVFYGMKKNSL
ncbi:class I SAM-dependent methyltransferase [Lysinibacillus yapensis]|uniref:Class I SAM-dependent methyltransferase n=1 Tax=Ureibacillus yapensis TaxID=2304605 RepID=A0A396S9S7_9BACL|nr:class I SAM-dependent methyltransferase [Lysinibacillus yapensis]RHW35865.1 class I SAM-dependent methyltransferase [Lysinibacillus yapensis]